MLSLCKRKQTYVALSTAEVDYISLFVEVCEVVRILNLLVDLFGHEMVSTIIHCDNQSCVNLSKNPMFNYKLKHIEIW
jgi:hypothetical protein